MNKALETMDRLDELLANSKRGAAFRNTGTSYAKSADRKQEAVRFLELVVAGQVETAYQKYVDSEVDTTIPSFRQVFRRWKRP